MWHQKSTVTSNIRVSRRLFLRDLLSGKQKADPGVLSAERRQRRTTPDLRLHGNTLRQEKQPEREKKKKKKHAKKEYTYIPLSIELQAT